MKTVQKITFISLMFIVTSFTFGAQPKSVNAKVTSQKMLEKICKDVQLTDSQKIAIQKKAEVFIVKLQEANKLTNPEAQEIQKIQIKQAYKMGVDSILTESQKTILQEKRELRKAEYVSKQKK
ncbi:MAG: hypothetical protein JXQ69_01390 [Paludibacteraceae bacterium]|nr:hypothetical protein [Paludibacteraceae bacterium]MBN2786952.1 hypothetical protein [Paludibacteraceae bacterium]